MSATFEIPAKSDTLCFVIKDDEQELGRIEGTACQLHREVLKAMDSAGAQGDDVDYLPVFAKVLSEKFEFTVSEDTAYHIAETVFNYFNNEKKSTGG